MDFFAGKIYIMKKAIIKKKLEFEDNKQQTQLITKSKKSFTLGWNLYFWLYIRSKEIQYHDNWLLNIYFRVVKFMMLYKRDEL